MMHITTYFLQIELHQLIISCNADFLAKESCCDLAATKVG